MAGFREEAAETVWVLSKILKPKVPQGGSVNLSFLANTKVQMYPLQKSSAFYNIVRKLAFSHGDGWLVGHWYVRRSERFLFASLPAGGGLTLAVSYEHR
jgi:hypothetical protein